MLEFHLENYLSDYSIVGRYVNVQEGLIAIVNKRPDIIFLDVNMPTGSGIDLLTKIQHMNCKVILLTAHAEYALDAIKHNAFDYLLKPIQVEELYRVDLKIRMHNATTQSRRKEKIKIHISAQTYLFDSSDILYASSEGNYTTIYSRNQSPLIVSKNMKKIQTEYFSELPFFRSHQSYLVNLEHVVSYSNYEIVLSNGSKVSLSGKNYDELKKLL